MALSKQAQQWVDALRSGEYKQAEGYLRKADDTVCCLGIACELYKKEYPNYICMILDGRDAYSYGPMGRGSALPNEVQEWLGLTSDLGSYVLLKRESLGQDNDDGMSFEDIADIIESEPEGLFI